jgi:hypothetical protein
MAISRSPGASVILQRLLAHVDAIVARLADRDAWRCAQVWSDEGDASYLRLVCVDHLRAERAPNSEYMVGVHLFDISPARGALHDHRYPMAVYPVGQSREHGMLYEMPWESHECDRVVRGCVEVRAREPYAMERASGLYHAVHSLRPHASISLADVTGPPARENRLTVREIFGDEKNAIRQRAFDVLRRG